MNFFTLNFIKTLFPYETTHPYGAKREYQDFQYYSIFCTEKGAVLCRTEDINRRSEEINNPVCTEIFCRLKIEIFEQKTENQDISGLKFVVYNKTIRNIRINEEQQEV